MANPRVIQVSGRRWTVCVFFILMSGCENRVGRVVDEPCHALEPGNSSRRCYQTWSGEPLSGVERPCQVSLCFAGAMGHSPSFKVPFQNICANEPIPGLFKDCEAEGCQPTFDSFTDSNRSIYRRLFRVLDTNKDGQIDADDEQCELNLIGFSWGGVTANKIARRLDEDRRIAAGHARVTRMLLVDPYQPRATLKIPENVDRVRVWRQSFSPPGDCSRNAPGGPYKGLSPDCGEVQDCQDINISHVKGGEGVGHCHVAEFVRDSLMEEIHPRGSNRADHMAATEEPVE